MEITYRVSWRRDYDDGESCSATTVEQRTLLSGQGFGSLTCSSGCTGTITPLSYICTDFSLVENWSFGENHVVYTFPSTSTSVTIGFSGDAWIEPFNSGWNVPTTFSLTRRNDTGRINSTPCAITSPVIRLQEGCNHTLPIAVIDPDGDIVRCRWGIGSECGGICNSFPGAILDSSTCTFTYEANRGTGFSAAAIVIEDFLPGSLKPLSSVALQFLISIFASTESCSSQPQFVPPTTIKGSCVAIPSGTTFFTQIIANSGRASASITELQTAPPLGLSRSEIQRIQETDNYFVNITWTPQANQENQIHQFCYTAVTSDGLASEQNCIKFLVGTFPPQPSLNSAFPNQALVHPNHTTWTILFDQEIRRPSIAASVRFFDNTTMQQVYQIDASFSPEISFNNSEVFISPAFRFPEKAYYFITLDRGIVRGLEGCGPGNEPITDKSFWTFETMDITPPVITFVNNPSRTNENITIDWMSNEEVTWTCVVILFETENSPVNCSQALWNGEDLRGGSYKIEIVATDLAGNAATVSHNFIVDLTPPVAFINQRPALVSNQLSSRLTFSCNEICTFGCLLFEFNSSRGNIASCNQQFFSTLILEHNKSYVFVVIPTDDVSNHGEEISYTWETDFENPRIASLSNISTLCSEVSPDITGRPTAFDNRPEPVSIRYQDLSLGCYIQRTWTATDVAGNIDKSVQFIALEYSLSISFVPVLAFSCDSTMGTFNIPASTASAPNPCRIPLDLMFTDSVSEFTCPGKFTRNWTAHACGSVAEAVQTIRFFDTCPPNACGHNEFPPRGTCSFGQCSCTRPWSGSNCSVQIFEPEIGTINDTVLEEAEPYILSISLLQGTPPLSWTLISSPAGLRLNANMQQIVWARVRAGNHTVSVSIENEVGIFVVTWTLVVRPGYTATLDPVTPNTYPRAQPVTLTGRIEYFEGNQVRDFLAGIVPVSIDIRRGATTQTLTAFSLTDGTFSIVFNPAPTEYGSYTAQVRHPQLPLMSESVSWLFLGFRLIPSSISLSGETLSDFQETFYNTTMICNDGPADLTRLHMTTSIPTTDDLQVTVFLKQDPLTRNIKTGECIFIDITATSSRALRRLFVVRFETDEGASTSVLINLRIQQILPRFLISPSQISARIIQGKSIILQFNITNIGRATALNVQPILPNSPIFSLIGLGNNDSRYGNGQFNLKSEESASLSIQAMVNDKMPLGEISASFYIVSNEASQQIPVSLTVSSDTLMNLTIVVEDEYTYFASGEPLVSDAVVTIINYQQNIRTTVTTEERVGSALFVNIFEDRYEVFIEAPDHRSLHQVVITTIDNPTLTFFLERQAVTYTWSVTPVAFEDTYTITLEADFETNVPIPVVTVSPIEFDLEELELGFVDSIQLNITNHGLIRADNVNINLPTNHPFLEFTVDDEFLGYLEALSSVTAVVHISRRSVRKRALGLLTQITWIIYFINIAYSYVCRDFQIRSIPVVLRRPEIVISPARHSIFSCSGCEGLTRSGRGSGISVGRIGPFLQPSGSYFGGSGTGSGDNVPILSFNGFSAITPMNCNDCLQNLLSCFPTPKFPLAGCIPLIASGSGINGPIDIVKWINCLIPGKWVRSGRPKQAKLALEGSLCIYGVYDACFSDSSGGSSRKKRQTLLSTVNDHLESMYPIDLSLDLAVEIFGNDMWLSVGDPGWVSQVLEPVFDDASDGGVLITSAERLAILSVPPPGSTTIEDVEKLLNRLNNTLSGWNSGQLESINGSNIASYSFVQSRTNDINRYNEIAVNKGFSSYLDAYTFSANEINQLKQWEEEEGICAIVRIRIEQELAITREAFLAILEIDNQENVNLKQMTLEIIITDSSDGSVSTTKFVISNETLDGSLVRSGDTWTLMSGGLGSVEWLIVPLSEAAPESDRVYGVGGTLRYSFENENITIPLLPTLITVTPDPSLLVHYFWERVVVADDPFTEEVEPSIPFTLGVIVKNAGYGVANSLTLSSGQPEIIENEKGLLINFMIIGANIGNSSITPSLSLILGDLAPQSTVVVRWFMISSLQGEFRNFSATFQNINPLGDPRLSILDELQIHELIRNVKIYSENDDDGILDFLVNERRDIGAYPDGIYDSKTLIRYNVSRGAVLSVQPLSSSAASLGVSTTANETGWIYYRYTDVGGLLSQTALTLNTTKLTTTGYVQIPPENSWITLVDETLVLHILDFYESIHNELSFIVTLCTSNCTTTAIPFIGPTGTPPPATTIETTTDVSVNETEGTTTESGSDCKSNCTNTTMESTTVSENTETTTESSLNCTHNCSTTAEPFTRPTGTPNITMETTANDSVSVNEEATTESGSLSLAATMLPLLMFVSASFAENI